MGLFKDSKGIYRKIQRDHLHPEVHYFMPYNRSCPHEDIIIKNIVVNSLKVKL